MLHGVITSPPGINLLFVIVGIPGLTKLIYSYWLTVGLGIGFIISHPPFKTYRARGVLNPSQRAEGFMAHKIPPLGSCE